MDPSGSKRKGGLIPVTSLKNKKDKMEKLVSFMGAEEIYVVRQKKEKSYYRSGERKAETERQGIKFHHRKNTSRKWTRYPAI